MGMFGNIIFLLCLLYDSNTEIIRLGNQKKMICLSDAEAGLLCFLDSSLCR